MKILYFASVRAKIGKSGEDLTPPPGVKTVGQLMRFLQSRGEGYAEAFADHARVRAAVNQEHVNMDASVAASDEVAFFPPVTGG
jgi:molybdopterin synthase sulfur carrier subunit